MNKFKLNLHKFYFEKGYALTNYIKYLIALFGLSSMNFRLTIILGIAYGFFCYALGFIWVYFDFYSYEIEVSNYYNPFVKEMRKEMTKSLKKSYSVERKL